MRWNSGLAISNNRKASVVITRMSFCWNCGWIEVGAGSAHAHVAVLVHGAGTVMRIVLFQEVAPVSISNADERRCTIPSPYGIPPPSVGGEVRFSHRLRNCLFSA